MKYYRGDIVRRTGSGFINHFCYNWVRRVAPELYSEWFRTGTVYSPLPGEFGEVLVGARYDEVNEPYHEHGIETQYIVNFDGILLAIDERSLEGVSMDKLKKAYVIEAELTSRAEKVLNRGFLFVAESWERHQGVKYLRTRPSYRDDDVRKYTKKESAEKRKSMIMANPGKYKMYLRIGSIKGLKVVEVWVLRYSYIW